MSGVSDWDNNFKAESKPIYWAVFDRAGKCVHVGFQRIAFDARREGAIASHISEQDLIPRKCADLTDEELNRDDVRAAVAECAERVRKVLKK